MPHIFAANWIFIRGLGRETQAWGPFLAKMESAILKVQPEAQFEYLDLAGNGSQKTKQSFTHVSQYCEDLRARSKFIQNNQPVNLITISLASMIAVYWSLHHHDLQKIVLMNTSDKNFSKFFERMQPRNLKFALKLFQKQKQSNENKAYTMFPDTTRENLLCQLIAAARFGFPKSKPHGDFLMLSSLGDELVNPKCSERISHAWKLPHSVHPTGAHDIPVDQPDWCVQEISKWLGKKEL